MKTDPIKTNTIARAPWKLNTLLLAVAVAFLLGTFSPVRAFSFHAGPLPARTAYGLFPKVRRPKINFGKGAKAILYPVTKTAVNGGKMVVGSGKAVVNGGVVVVKGAQKGAEIYEAGRSLSSKTNGAPGFPRLK